MTLTDDRTLGCSGLVVSPLALGTMTFGTHATIPETVYPYPIFSPAMNRMIFGGTTVTGVGS